MPKITELELQKKNKDRYNIYVDNEYYTSADAIVIIKNKLESGQDIELSFLEKVCMESNIEKAKKYVLDYCLGKTEQVVRQKLKHKGYDLNVINKIIEFLFNYNLVNDEQYALSYAHDALFLKKYGTHKIKFMLKLKGVSEENIKNALNKIKYSDEMEIATKLYNNVLDKYKRKAKNERDLKNKIYTYLSSRGFQNDIINGILSEF